MNYFENLSPDKLVPLILFSMLPIAVLFAAERLSLIWLGKKSWGKKWVQNTFWMHPNFISRCRYPMGFVAVFLYHYGFQKLGILWFSAWMITDLTDGTIARKFDLHTPEGEVIDPLSDKLLYLPPILYMSYLGVYRLELVIALFSFDFIGQVSRNFIEDKSANLFGKAKTFLAVVSLMFATSHITYLLDGSWQETNDSIWSIHNLLMTGTVTLAFSSMFFKIVPNYWYANILSIMNFLCGISGIALIIWGYPPHFAFGLIFLGQFLDLFDGRAAEKWGSTPKGELLDDIADGTNFGFTLAMVIYSSIANKTIGIALGLLYFVTTVLRLRKFLIDKKNQAVKGGVRVFSGLPSPAAALFAGSFVLLFQNYIYLQIAGVVLTSILMISHVPYIHFGRVILPALPKLLNVIILVLIIVTVLITLNTHNVRILLYGVLFFSMAYLMFGHSKSIKK